MYVNANKSNIILFISEPSQSVAHLLSLDTCMPIWGPVSAVKYLAMRFFLGVGKYNAAVLAQMEWIPPSIIQ